GIEIFADGGDATAQANVLAARGFGRPLERSLDAVGYEMKGRAAGHGDRCARMMREHKDRNVIGRVVAPPALPGVVWPRPAHGSKHVAAQNPGAKIDNAARREVVVGAGRSTLFPEQHLLKRPRRQDPLVQRHATHTKRVLEALPRARTVAIERYRKTLN